MLISDPLWHAYKNTRFRWLNQPLTSPTFAIITAYNPRSQIRREQDNVEQQSRLLALIEENQWPSALILAGDKTFDYFEPSVAVNCSLIQGLELGKKFEQNAIYFVQNDELILVPVLVQSRPYENLGVFSQNFIKLA